MDNVLKWLAAGPLTVWFKSFYVAPDHFVVCDVFLSVFWWIYCYNKLGQEHTFPSRRFGLSRPSSVNHNFKMCGLNHECVDATTQLLALPCACSLETHYVIYIFK